LPVDLSRENNFSSDNYHEQIESFSIDDPTLANKIIEELENFEKEKYFPFHAKKLLVNKRRRGAEINTIIQEELY